MSIGDFNRQKILSVTSYTGTPTIPQVVPIRIVGGDDSTTGTGDIVLDWTDIATEADIGLYDETNTLLDYWVESFDAGSETATLHVFRDWVRDGTAQLKIGYGTGPSDQSVASSIVFDKETDLKSAYAFNETSGNLLDITSNGENGILNGGVTQGATGQVGEAYSFDGIDDYVGITQGVDNISGATALSVSFWFKKDAGTLGDDGVILIRGVFGGNAPLLFWYDAEGFDTGNKNTVSVQVKGDGVTAKIEGDDETVSGGDWHQATMTFLANSVEGLNLYRDCSLCSSSNVSTAGILSIDSSADDLEIGGSSVFGSDKFTKGQIDELRIYSRVLSQHEIVASYASTKDSPAFFTQAEGRDSEIYEVVTRAVTLQTEVENTVTLTTEVEKTAQVAGA